MYLYTYMHVSVYIYIYIYLSIYTYVFIHVYIHIKSAPRARLAAAKTRIMGVCMHNTHLSTHTHIYMNIAIHLYTNIYICMDTYIYIYTYIREAAHPWFVRRRLAFTRYCHHQERVVYGIQKGSR